MGLVDSEEDKSPAGSLPFIITYQVIKTNKNKNFFLDWPYRDNASKSELRKEKDESRGTHAWIITAVKQLSRAGSRDTKGHAVT